MYKKAIQEGSDIVQSEFIRDNGNISPNVLTATSPSALNSEAFDLSNIDIRKRVISVKKRLIILIN